METIQITYPHSFQKDELPATIAAIGFFDGVHIGHQAVIEAAVQEAKRQQKTSAVISFHPHPSVVLKQPKQEVQYITTIPEKEAILKELGVDRLYLVTFNQALSLLSPKEFLDHFVRGLHIDHLIAGFDFSFGHKGAGNMNNIEEWTEGTIRTTAIDKVEGRAGKISSTAIRKALSSGDVQEAAALLGRSYNVKGEVIPGEKRGRQLGFPTANLHIDEAKLLPKQGVYAVQAVLKGQTYDGMASIGVKPTFHTGITEPIVEVNLFDFDEDIYGETLDVIWHAFTREEKKFNGIDEIIDQLKDDEKTIRDFFS